MKQIFIFLLCSLSAFVQAQTLADTTKLEVFDRVKSWHTTGVSLRTYALGSAFVSFLGPTTSIKTFTLPNVSSTILTDASTLTIGQGGTGTGSTLTGMLLGGASAYSAITSTTAGQIPRCTGSNTFAFGALDLADADAVTGVLPYANGGSSITTGRSTAQTAAVASVATLTVGGSDATYEISGNILVTTSGSESFSLQVDFTDEGNTARTATIPLVRISTGGFTATTISASGAVPYPSSSIQIRAKASTAITIKTSGTFTGCTYNVEGRIQRL